MDNQVKTRRCSFLESYFRLLGRWVRAEAAADLAALLDFGLRRTLDAADAALLLVTSLFFFRLIRNVLPTEFGHNLYVEDCPLQIPYMRGGSR